MDCVETVVHLEDMEVVYHFMAGIALWNCQFLRTVVAVELTK
jgi:hypothetical protein